MEDWKTYTLDELIDVNLTPVKNGDFEWIHYIDIKSVGPGYYEKPLKLEFKKAPSRARRKLANGNTVISTVRPNLRSFFYCRDIPENAVASTGFVVLSARNIDPRFLYYLTTNDNYINYLVQSCSGSAYPAFSPKVILDSKVTIPPLSEQKSIASILSALDDQIELNLQMNKTLEEMAMALYKHWFVDFGPFQNGKFVESELGMIPKGWEVKPLNDLGNIFYGKMPKKDKLQDVGYPVYSGYSYVGFYPEYNCKTGKVIVVARGVGGTGDIKITSENCFLTNLSICLNNDHDLIHDSILYYNLKRNNLHHLRTGSAQPQITIGDLNGIQILVPSKIEQSNFLEKFLPLTSYMKINTQENQTLTTLRDTLLPKLISGQIRVKDVEQMVAASL